MEGDTGLGEEETGGEDGYFEGFLVGLLDDRGASEGAGPLAIEDSSIILVKLGVPSPVTASHPGLAENPCEQHGCEVPQELSPITTSLKEVESFA